MRKTIILFILLILIAKTFTQELYIVNSSSETISHVQIPQMTSTNNFAQIGIWANQVIYHETQIYVVNSGDNNIQILNNAGTTQDYLYLEDSSNPYNIIIHNDFAYVTGWGTGKLYKINLDSKNQSFIEIGTGPQSMIIRNDFMYISLSGFNYTAYESGKIAIVNLNTFSLVGYIDVHTNPQEMLFHNDQLHIICTGDYAYQPSKVVVIELPNDEEDGVEVGTIEFPWSFFTTIQKGPDGLIYIGSGLGLGFASYNANTLEIVNNMENIAFPTGQSLIYDADYIYVLSPDYFFNSKLLIYNYRKELVNQIELGIGSISMCFKADPVSIKDNPLPDILTFNTYPNPFTTNVKFDVRGFTGNVLIEIYNVKGQKIGQTEKLEWDIENLPAGIYFARVTDSEKTLTRRIVKVR